MNNVCEGIVLRQREFKDNDVILQVLTKEEGTLSFVAKGIQKAKSKNASACELFCYSRFYYNHKDNSDLQLLKTAERITIYRHIYDDLTKQIIASLLCEIISKIDKEESYDMFILLEKCLTYINEGNNDFGVLGFFVAKVNERLGIAANVDGCIHCGSTQVVAISIRNGGFVCGNCYHEQMDVKTSLPRLRFFRLFHKAGWNDYPTLSTISTYSYEDIKPILLMFLEYSGIHLQGIKLLEEIITIDMNE